MSIKTVGATASSPAATDAERTSRRPSTSARDDLVTVAFGGWLVLGLFVDGWAHVNLPGLETFFTPWHGLLYSGFLAGTLWLVALARRGRRLGRPWHRALPVGYPPAAVGVLIFGAGGLGDMLWHLAFGVETGLDALLSPTHLVLLTGGALVLTSALRAGWARPMDAAGPSLRTELPAALSLALVTALAAFFLLYSSVFTVPAAAEELTRIPEGAPGHEAAELPAVAGLSAYLVTTVLLVAPVLLADRAGRRPHGLIVLLVAAVAWLSVSVGGFTPYGITAATAVTVAAGLAELVVARMDRIEMPDTLRAPALAAATATLLWTAQLLAVAVTEGIRWPVELWSGVVLLSALAASGLGLLTAWPPGDGSSSTSRR